MNAIILYSRICLQQELFTLLCSSLWTSALYRRHCYILLLGRLSLFTSTAMYLLYLYLHLNLYLTLGLQIGLLLFLEGAPPSLQVSCHCKQVQRCTILLTPDVDASLQNRSPPTEKHKRQIAKLPNKLSTVGIICSSYL